MKISLKNFNEEYNEAHFLEVDVQYPDKLRECHNDLPFLPDRMKIVANLNNKTKCIIRIRNLKQEDSFYKKLIELLNLIELLG